jgi:hypothetical protein
LQIHMNFGTIIHRQQNLFLENPKELKLPTNSKVSNYEFIEISFVFF